MSQTLVFLIIAAVLSVISGGVLGFWVLGRAKGSEETRKTAKAIKRFSQIYLYRQYRAASVMCLFVFFLLGFAFDWNIALGFLVGSVFSGAAGYLSVAVAESVNARTVHAAGKGIGRAASVALRSGAVTAFVVLGLGLLCVSCFYALTHEAKPLVGLIFGASLFSVFIGVAGVIYAKSCDANCSLARKNEKKISDDDARLAMILMDGAKGKVGDIMGTAADLFGTYIVGIVSAILLGTIMFPDFNNAKLYPLILGGVSIVGMILFLFFTGVGKKENIIFSLYKGLAVSSVFVIISFYLASNYLMRGNGLYPHVNLFYSALIGMGAAWFLIAIAERYTSGKFNSDEITPSSCAKDVTAYIAGRIVESMKSTIFPIIIIASAIWGSYVLAGLYGIAVAATGMLSLSGIIIIIGVYGSVVKSAEVIAEMSVPSEDACKIISKLVCAENKTKVVIKWYAAGSAALSVFVLFILYSQEFLVYGREVLFRLSDPLVIVGLLMGAAISWYFCVMIIEPTREISGKLSEEMLRCFRTVKNLAANCEKTEHDVCFGLAINGAICKMLVPSVVPLFLVIVAGRFLGPVILGGMLVGAIIVGIFWSFSMAIAAGNCNKLGKYAQLAYYVGKTPKDCARNFNNENIGYYKYAGGPAINSLVKAISIVAFLIVSFLV